MSNPYFCQVLDDPYYYNEDEYLSVVTTGKVRSEGELTRDVNKDACAKAGLLRVNAQSNETTFIDFHKHSEPGDRYRCVVVVDDIAYVMRTQKKHVDSVVRMAAVDLKTNEVKMIEEKAVSIHGTETPKTFCGHFNFGRPIVVGKKIVYPPLNSGVIIVYDTETNTFVAHDVPDSTASIWCTYVPELKEIVFFPYGSPTNKLLVLNLISNEHRFIEAPSESAFYSTFTSEGKAIGVPLSMVDTDKLYFWIYDGVKVDSIEYSPSATHSDTGMLGFKYGVLNNGNYYAHTCWEKGQELVKLNLVDNVVSIIKTDMPLGTKPYVMDDEVYLFPSITNPAMTNIPYSVYKVTGDSLVEDTKLPTNNITYGPINESTSTVLFVPYRFDLNDDNRLEAPLTVLDLRTKDSKNIKIELDLE
jgi:hypothetical protein